MHRHELDPVSLTFGFVFAGLGLLLMFGQVDEALRLRWVWPLLLLALGVGILLDVTRQSRRDPDSDPSDRDPADHDAGRDPDAVELDAGPAGPDPARPA
jgi:hypothetical protein